MGSSEMEIVSIAFVSTWQVSASESMKLFTDPIRALLSDSILIMEAKGFALFCESVFIRVVFVLAVSEASGLCMKCYDLHLYSWRSFDT